MLKQTGGRWVAKLGAITIALAEFNLIGCADLDPARNEERPSEELAQVESELLATGWTLTSKVANQLTFCGKTTEVVPKLHHQTCLSASADKLASQINWQVLNIFSLRGSGYSYYVGVDNASISDCQASSTSQSVCHQVGSWELGGCAPRYESGVTSYTCVSKPKQLTTLVGPAWRRLRADGGILIDGVMRGYSTGWSGQMDRE
jgi:hypothetical protein